MKVYTQNRFEAQEILTKVLTAFEQHKVTPNPMNFFVWYEYFLGDNTALKATMDNALQSRDGYSDSLGVRVYKEYLKDTQSDTSDLEKAFRKLLEMMVSKLMDWTKNMDTHAAALDTYVDQLSGINIDPETLKSLTGHVLSTTRSIMASQTDLQQELLAASQQIKGLQSQLEASRQEAMTDMLTRLANRRWFEQDIEAAMQRCKRPNELALILLDIDHFKSFNDTYGHLVGDAVLRFIGGILQKTVEPSHLVARIGGEEFAVMITNASIEQALSMAEKLRRKVEVSQLTRKDTGETIGNIKISLGVGTYIPGESWDTLYQRVDKALYMSKHNGRNQSTIAK